MRKHGDDVKPLEYHSWDQHTGKMRTKFFYKCLCSWWIESGNERWFRFRVWLHETIHPMP